jgi:large subunit ribosomal protein L22
MEVQAVEKYIRISPKKARLVADVVRGENAVSALATLRFMPVKSAGIIYKALHSAMANATNNFGLDKNALVISKITIDKGPSLKRFRPRSRGMASALLKRTSHVTVVVSAEPAKKTAKKEEAK